MSDPALHGNCLSCGRPAYAQSHCDNCSEDVTYECADCGGDGFEKPYLNCFEHEMDDLRETILDLKKKIAMKDARIHELELGLDALDKGLEELRGM